MANLQQLLGARIRICIEKAGFRTVEEFAFEHGISKSTLSDVINGKKSPTVSTLARWANALQIHISDFFEDDRINDLVREPPPGYFRNRGKTARTPRKPKATKRGK